MGRAGSRPPRFPPPSFVANQRTFHCESTNFVLHERKEWWGGTQTKKQTQKQNTTGRGEASRGEKSSTRAAGFSRTHTSLPTQKQSRAHKHRPQTNTRSHFLPGGPTIAGSLKSMPPPVIAPPPSGQRSRRRRHRGRVSGRPRERRHAQRVGHRRGSHLGGPIARQVEARIITRHCGPRGSHNRGPRPRALSRVELQQAAEQGGGAGRGAGLGLCGVGGWGGEGWKKRGVGAPPSVRAGPPPRLSLSLLPSSPLSPCPQSDEPPSPPARRQRRAEQSARRRALLWLGWVKKKNKMRGGGDGASARVFTVSRVHRCAVQV